VNAWRVCTLEIDRGGLSYTVDTLRQLHTELPEAQLFFMIGADAIRDVPQWKEPAEIFRLATPLVVHRAGRPDPDFTSIAPLCTAHTQPQLIEMPSVDVSSSEIRSRVAAGAQVGDVVPVSVAKYISEHALYR
jgi:nicotinate-nucleotide adenylyltransferase